MAKTVDKKELVESRSALRLGLRLGVFFLCLYFLFWGVLAVYFNNAERHKDLLETTLENFFKRDVHVEKIITTWRGLNPLVQIQGFSVEGDQAEQPVLAFDLLSAEINPLSILRFWPEFNEITIQRPQLEIKSLGSQGVRIAGIRLASASDSTRIAKPQRIIKWLGSHKNMAWANGEINWQRSSGDRRQYKDISFLYNREQQRRTMYAVIGTPKGGLRFHSESNGDLFSENNWDADFQVMSSGGKQLVAPDDLSFSVNNGQGRLRIKTLDIERIRDFIQVSGLTDRAGWLFDAQLSGRLHDAAFVFSGPLFNIEDWSLIASASGVAFKSIGNAPSMNNLEGSVNVSSSGGKFGFSTRNSVFQWSRWFDQQFPVTVAEGEFSWQIQDNGDIDLDLTNGRFEDKNARIFNLNAHLDLDKKSQGVTKLDDLLGFVSFYHPESENADSNLSSSRFKAPVLNASAEFDVFKMEALDDYLPNNKGVDSLKRWWSNAFKSGETTGAKITYAGELSMPALLNGQAQLTGAGDFANVHVDYGYLQNWPEVKKGRGRVSLKNDVFTLEPEEVWLEQDKVTQSKVDIVSLFSIDRTIVVDTELQISLINVAEFLFRGPLIKPENKPEKLPITITDGSVTAQSVITIPLLSVNETTVVATAQIENGGALLPPAVPIENISADVSFTERSVRSNNIKANFLGGTTQGQLETTKQSVPPQLKLSATGNADVDELIPWTGEHLNTWFAGQAQWQGTVDLHGTDIRVGASSSLQGVEVVAPPPLAKASQEVGEIALNLNLGNKQNPQELAIKYNDVLYAIFKTKPSKDDASDVSFFDQSIISLGEPQSLELADGVNIQMQADRIDLDSWLDGLLDLVQFQPKIPLNNTDFLDALRSVRIQSTQATCLDRNFGELELSAVSVDGEYWIGSVRGANANGTWQAQPRAEQANYVFNFDDLNFPDRKEKANEVSAINYDLKPQEYPTLSLNVDDLKIAGRHFGTLTMRGEPKDDRWQLSQFQIAHNGIRSTVTGGWTNNLEQGSVSSFDYEVLVDEAEGALDTMDFDGFIKKGTGTLAGKLNWLGAPHEFDYSRLGGDFYVRIIDGELEKVDSGSGKLLGLLNFNALARRLTFDFRDVFASGLKFDRMVYSGVLAGGEAIMREAYVLTPAVFVRLEGKLDLGKELIDMEIHIAPELAGNLVLLSALANPAAGAVVFLTQRIFKDEMRQASFKSYRALGTWQDFELVDLDESQVDDEAVKESQ